MRILQAVAISVLLYGCTTSTLIKYPEKKTRWKLHKDATCGFEQILEAAPHKTAAVQLLISHLTNHAEHCWKSKDKLISNVLLWTPTDEHTSVDQPAKTYIHQFCMDTGCHLEDLLRVMTNRDW